MDKDFWSFWIWIWGARGDRFAHLDLISDLGKLGILNLIWVDFKIYASTFNVARHHLGKYARLRRRDHDIV